jgi:hypothetical protein
MLGVLNCLRVVSVGNHFLWIRDIPVGFILLADAHLAQLLLPFMTGIVLFFSLSGLMLERGVSLNIGCIALKVLIHIYRSTPVQP